MAPLMKVDIASPAFKADPYPFYARLRAETPVCRVPLMARHDAWLVSRYDDVAAILKDDRFAKDRTHALTAAQLAKQPWIPSLFKPLMRNMLDLDEPDHGRLRALVHKAFTPRLVEKMRQRVHSLTDELLDAAQAKGSMELIRDYAMPLPTTVIAETLGVPVRDRHKFARWSNAFVSSSSTVWGVLKTIPSALAIIGYIRKLIKSRHAEPRDDLVSALVAAEEAGDQLSEDEVMAMIFLLLVAGFETTVNLIGNGTLALLRHPDEMKRLRDNPALIKSAVEELLRFESPIETATQRYTSADVTIAGETIPRGEMVFAVIASANRDASQFERPDELDLAREPNRHLSFGLGGHYCLGAPLARLEGQIAINALLRRAPDLQLAAPLEMLRWRRGLVLRGLKELPVAFAGSPATR